MKVDPLKFRDCVKRFAGLLEDPECDTEVAITFYTEDFWEGVREYSGLSDKIPGIISLIIASIPDPTERTSTSPCVLLDCPDSDNLRQWILPIGQNDDCTSERLLTQQHALIHTVAHHLGWSQVLGLGRQLLFTANVKLSH